MFTQIFIFCTIKNILRMKTAIIIISIFLIYRCAAHQKYDTDGMHSTPDFALTRSLKLEGVEDAEFWVKSGQDTLRSKLGTQRLEKQAKNIIFFLGDGMSLPTITAARILKGQREGLKFGEEAELYFETFPSIGVSKTYCVDKQVADSACSATAYLGGVKNNYGTIGVTSAVSLGDCSGQNNTANHVSSILAWAQAAGKSTGVVTTTNLLDASPSGTFGHIANRDWNSDTDVVNAGHDPAVCMDLAQQLIVNEPGSNFNVILGGGRTRFRPSTEADEEEGMGVRSDGKNLIDMWAADKQSKNAAHQYVWNQEELLGVDTSKVDYLLGLFAPSDLGYLDEAPSRKDPELHEMTKVAIEILRKNPNGFCLFVEGGLIDNAHHGSNAQRALVEALELEKAVKLADSVTDDSDTLITVTADHAHVLSISGYPIRGNPLFEIAEDSDVDGLPYSTLHYANGPSYRHPNPNGGGRVDISEDNFNQVTYKQTTTLPLGSETHGGDDVLVFTKGPFSHLLNGVVQQNYIPHALAYAACVGEGATFCKE